MAIVENLAALVIGQRYRFYFRYGEILVGIYRGRKGGISGANAYYYFISVTDGKTRGFAAGYNGESIIKAETA